MPGLLCGKETDGRRMDAVLIWGEQGYTYIKKSMLDRHHEP